MVCESTGAQAVTGMPHAEKRSERDWEMSSAVPVAVAYRIRTEVKIGADGDMARSRRNCFCLMAMGWN